MPRTNFDRLAEPYVWLERLSFGRKLQWCRTALLGELADARTALVLGDGDGRFLDAFVAANAGVRVDAVDISPAMAAAARRRVGTDRVHFTVADVRAERFPPAHYDVVVTNFFFDCFPEMDLENLIARLAAALKPGGRWLVGDFRRPEEWGPRLAADAALAGMYLFFRVVARIPASRLVDPAPMLERHGLSVEKVESRLKGFLTATLWRKPE